MTRKPRPDTEIPRAFGLKNGDFECIFLRNKNQAKIPDIFDWTFTSEENLILQVVFDFEEP